MFKVIALDLDGTLFRSDGFISQRTLSAISRCSQDGIRVVIVTARPPRSITRMLPKDFPRCLWICYHGAEVWDGDTLLAEDHIRPESIQEIIACIQNVAPEAHIYVESYGRLVTNKPIDYPTEHTVVNLMSLGNITAAKILFELPEISNINEIIDHLPMACKLVKCTIGGFGEIVSESASKVRSLTMLLADWELSFQDVIAFGDDLPDAEMLALSGIGVAMGNATPEVKSVADRITLSNDEDGIAVILEEQGFA